MKGIIIGYGVTGLITHHLNTDDSWRISIGI